MSIVESEYIMAPKSSAASRLDLIMQGEFSYPVGERRKGNALLDINTHFKDRLREERGTLLLETFLKLAAPGDDTGPMLSVAKDLLLNPEASEDHYRTFQMRKKDGGFRTIDAPEPPLKRLQRHLLDRWWYAKRLLSDCLHGFVPKRGTLTCAGSHLAHGRTGRGMVLIKVDIRDFFSSITRGSVMNTLLDNLATWVLGNGIKRRFPSILLNIYENSPDMKPGGMPDFAKKGIFPTGDPWFYEVVADEICLDYVALKVCCLNERLPQGSPCSPALANLFLAKLHNQTRKCLRDKDLEYNDYTGYADDTCLTVPVNGTGRGESMGDYLSILCREIYRYPDISVNQKKIGVFKPGKRQKITGICITDGLTISRQDRDKVRAELHNAVTGRKRLSDEDKMRLRGVRAWMRGVDADGWDARCEKDFMEAVGK